MVRVKYKANKETIFGIIMCVIGAIILIVTLPFWFWAVLLGLALAGGGVILLYR